MLIRIGQQQLAAGGEDLPRMAAIGRHQQPFLFRREADLADQHVVAPVGRDEEGAGDAVIALIRLQRAGALMGLPVSEQIEAAFG